MSHTIEYETQQGRDRGEDFIVAADELTPEQNWMMDLAAQLHRTPPQLNN